MDDDDGFGRVVVVVVLHPSSSQQRQSHHRLSASTSRKPRTCAHERARKRERVRLCVTSEKRKPSTHVTLCRSSNNMKDPSVSRIVFDSSSSSCFIVFSQSSVFFTALLSLSTACFYKWTCIPNRSPLPTRRCMSASRQTLRRRHSY